MNNKPVAWMFRGYLYEKDPSDWSVHEHPHVPVIPLYTHPVKKQDEPNWKEMYWEMHELNHKHWSELKAHPVKELTDEEIIEIGLLTTDPRFSHIESPLLLEFARAILRKAQEK